jgi:transcriptional regulator with XRE-family HTH domain
MSITQPCPVGHLLRLWRQRRRLSQLELALAAEISSRHLSFLETGRSLPSREMLLRLAKQLTVPLRDQNALLIAAGYAPIFPERPLGAPELEAARRAVELVLAGHEPAPAIAFNRHWILVAANRVVAPLLVGVDPALLQPPVNLIRLALHPAGLAPHVINFGEWRAHLIARLREQVAVSGDLVLSDLLSEVTAYPFPTATRAHPYPPPSERAPLVVSLRVRTPAGQLAFFSTTTVFGTPVDITLDELAIETFFPADGATAQALQTVVARL